MEAYYAFIGVRGQARTLWALAADQYCIEQSKEHKYWIKNMRKSHVAHRSLSLPLSLEMIARVYLHMVQKHQAVHVLYAHNMK